MPESFMSYIGLFSCYNFDNWAYQPSFVSSNTPWFFNGVRIQLFPTEKLKIEPWFINGWQSYGTANRRPGLGAQILWRPAGSVSIISNNYGVGRDTLGAPHRTRFDTDNSLEVKYFDKPATVFDKAAFPVTVESGIPVLPARLCPALRRISASGRTASISQYSSNSDSGAQLRSASCAAGRISRNVVSPGRLVTVRSPWWALAMLRAMLRPSPEPGICCFMAGPR